MDSLKQLLAAFWLVKSLSGSITLKQNRILRSKTNSFEKNLLSSTETIFQT